ncbi:dystrotelin isoform 1-T2 [Liasis olivaceus]
MEESTEALYRERRYLRKQLNKWKDKMQLFHSAQEAKNSVLETKWHELETSQKNLMSEFQQMRDRNRILEMNCHELITRQENLEMEVQKMRLDIQNITTCHQKSLKKRNVQNGAGCPSIELNHVGFSNLHSSCVERKWLIEPQADLLPKNTGSSEITMKSDFSPNIYPDVIHNETLMEGIVPLTSNSGNLKHEINRNHFSKGIKIRSSHCTDASEVRLREKWIEKKEELQQLMRTLKETLDLQVQPGDPSEGLLPSAEHLCKSFSDLITQVASPTRKTEVAGNGLSILSDLPS